MNVAPTSFTAPLIASTRATRSLPLPGHLEMKDLSEVGGSVVGGVWGYTMGAGIGTAVGHLALGSYAPAATIALGAGGAYMFGNWGYNVGFKTSLCVAAGSIIMGHLGQMAMGTIGGFAGTIAGGALGLQASRLIGKKHDTQG